jgi:ABC-type multidrug transport system ATPase subunit
MLGDAGFRHSRRKAAIQSSLDTLMASKTVIAIAHRLSTVARMDRLVVLDRGRIAEQGTHEALLSALPCSRATEPPPSPDPVEREKRPPAPRGHDQPQKRRPERSRGRFISQGAAAATSGRASVRKRSQGPRSGHFQT